MIDLKRIPEIIQGRTLPKSGYPKHVIINSAKTELTKDLQKARLATILEMVQAQVELELPVLTIGIGTKEDVFDEVSMYEFLEDQLYPLVVEKKIRTTFIGKWYSLPGMLVESMKRIIQDTRDFEVFLNLCINYDPQEEIVDACRVIIRKIYDSRMDPDSVTKDVLKENIYSAYFPPADLVVETGNRFQGTFMWDTKSAKIYFSQKPFEEFRKAELQKAIEHYGK